MNGMQILAILGALVFAGGVVAYFVISSRRPAEEGSIEARLTNFAERPRTLEQIELEQPFADRVIKPIVDGMIRFLGKFSPGASQEKTERNLMTAGNPGGMHAANFLGLRVFAGLTMLLLFGFLFGVVSPTDPPQQGYIYALVTGLLGYMLPVFWLGSKMRQRVGAIRRQLPDMIDLLQVSVEAGLGLDAAFSRIAEKMDNQLGVEVQKVVSEIKVGKTRRDALREMAVRTGVDEVKTFISSIVQAEQLGVSMGKVLRIQSDQMRIRRRQLAEEKAHRAPVLMLIPMAFFIFPALYIVILGPAVPQVWKSLSGG